MQKKIIISIISLLLVLGISFSPHVRAQADSPDYLIHPTHVSNLNDALYVYDDYNQEIRSGAKSISLPGVKKLTNNGTYLFALTETQSGKDLVVVEPDLTSSTPLSFTLESFQKEKITDFAVNGDKVYILKSDGNIDWFTVTGTTLSLPNTLSKDNIPTIQGSDITLTTIETSGDKLHLTTDRISFNLDPETYGVTELTRIENDARILKTDKEYALTSDNCIIDTNTGTHFDTLCEVNITGFTASDGILYITSATTHQVFKYEIATESLTDLKINPDVTISRYSPQNFIHIKLSEIGKFYYMPYSVNITLELEPGSYVNVIGESGDFYYCLITTKTENSFLFLKKITLHESLNLGSNGGNFTATRNIKVFALPTTIEDDINSSLKEISAGTEIEVMTSSTLQNTYGDLFYVTKVGETYGFVRSNFLQSMRGTVELTNHNNAKTKRATTIYENADGTGEIIELARGTRIALLEDPAPNKTYLLAEYQDAKGVVYTGYVFSEDIKKDGLSTLQILGLILIVANITVLTMIILIKRRSRKWKVKTHPGDTNAPHHLDLT